jgi:hypothetical protein
MTNFKTGKFTPKNKKIKYRRKKSRKQIFFFFFFLEVVEEEEVSQPWSTLFERRRI